MPQTTSQAASNIFPCLRYHDAPAAIEWLVKVFGFEKQMVVPGSNGSVAHAQLKIGPGIVMLGSSQQDQYGMKTPRELGGVNQSIYVALPDVDSHYHRAKAAGAEIVTEIKDTDHGSRDYSARDLEGNLWHFGTYMPEAHENE